MTLPALCNRQTAENCQYLRFCFIAPGLFYYPGMSKHIAKPPAGQRNGRIRPLMLFLGALLLAWPHGVALSDEMASKANNASSARHLLYEAYWGGLHVADFSLSMEKKDGSFGNFFKLETRGLTKFLSNISVVAESRGKVMTGPNGQNGTNDNIGITGSGNGAAASAVGDLYLPSKYRTDYSNVRHFRWVEILFPYDSEETIDQPAQAMTGTRPLPDKPEKWKPEDEGPEKLDKVKDEMLFGVVDPLTALVQSLSGVALHLKGGPNHFSIKSFDGRRRFDFDVDYLGVASRVVNKVSHETYHIRVTPRPVAGFKEKHKIFWEQSVFDFFLARDGSFAPIQIVPVKHGPVLSLKSVCNSPCKIPTE